MVSGFLDKMAGFGHYLFLFGFLGVLYTFLWFFFRYLDRKKLLLPTIAFALFFVVFLGGGGSCCAVTR